MRQSEDNRSWPRMLVHKCSCTHWLMRMYGIALTAHISIQKTQFTRRLTVPMSIVVHYILRVIHSGDYYERSVYGRRAFRHCRFCMQPKMLCHSLKSHIRDKITEWHRFAQAHNPIEHLAINWFRWFFKLSPSVRAGTHGAAYTSIPFNGLMFVAVAV